MHSSATEDLAGSIERYQSVALREGFGALRQLDDPTEALREIAAIKAVIAPRRLPPEIEWLWSCWDLSSIDYRISSFPELHGPLSVAGMYDYKYWPRALLPIGYQSHCSLSVELVYPGAAPRLVYFSDDSGFRAHARSIASIFDALTDTMDAARFEVDTDGSRFLLDNEVEERLHSDLIEAIDSADMGPFSEFEIREWPHRWRSQQGIDPSAWHLKGATHTIAEVHEARTHGSVEATIVASRGAGMTNMANGGGSLTIMYDETGSIDVWVPDTVPDLGMSADHRYELDITAEPSTPNEPQLTDFGPDISAVQRLGILGDIRAAARASRRMTAHLHSAHGIVASAQRPLQRPTDWLG